MKDKKSVLIFIYNSYRDPLFQNLLLNYIKTLSDRTDLTFDLITFEQQDYRMTAEEVVAEKFILSKYRINWYPRRFHTGKLRIIFKFYDLVSTLFLVAKLKIKNATSHILAFANVSASFSIILSKIFRTKLIIYSYEPHSQFMAELGIWEESSLSYIVLNFLEKAAGKHADVVMTGTKHGVNLLESLGAQGLLFRAPTAVDSEDFYFRAKGRESIRTKLGVEKRDVFLYIGKFGDLYYRQEVINVLRGVYEENKNSFFIIVTRYNHEEIKGWFTENNIPETYYYLDSNVSNEEVKNYISSADFGISAVPPSPSQKYRSPTKVAEYLLCGLPYLTCCGVAEDDDYAVIENVGVPLSSFSEKEIKKNYPQIKKLLEEEKVAQRNRCRRVGLEYRSKERIVNTMLTVFNDK